MQRKKVHKNTSTLQRCCCLWWIGGGTEMVVRQVITDQGRVASCKHVVSIKEGSKMSLEQP